MNNIRETIVFRLKPVEGKYYETTEFTRKDGKWPYEHYYTNKKLKYVGKFIKHEHYGWGDNASYYDIFDNDGEEVIVQYTYEGTTSYREVEVDGNSKERIIKRTKILKEEIEGNDWALRPENVVATQGLDISNFLEGK
jgi:hypothetical protein